MTYPATTAWATLTMRQLREACRELGISPGARGSTKPGIIAILVEHTMANDGATQVASTPTDTGSRLVAALEALYSAIQRRQADLPALHIITGSGVQGRLLRMGHYRPGAWRKAQEEGRLAEMFISGECIGQGAVSVLCTMLHGAAHVLAEVWEVKDTTRRGAYHNQQFIMVAEHLGLYWPEDKEANGTRGFSAVELRTETEAEYMMELVELDMAINASLETPEGFQGGDPRKGEGGHGVMSPGSSPEARTAAKWVCECAKPRIIRMARKTMEIGPITCSLCGSDFQEG